MALTLPVTIIEGTLTADPELRFTTSGDAVANISLACNTRKKDPQTGQWEDGETTFVRGSVWRKLAENVAESLNRGDRVLAHGVLKQRNFTDKNGVDRSVLEMDVDAVGASLRFATATVSRASGGGSRQQPQAGNGWDDGDNSGW